MLNLTELGAGAGPCLVLIHGTAGSPGSTWEGFASCLQGHYHILAVDLSRLAQVGAGAQTLEGLARLIAAQISRCAAEHVHLIGYSMGAALAVEVANVMPCKILSLTLIAPFEHARDPQVRSTFEHWRQLLKDNPKDLAAQIVMRGFCATSLNAMGSAQVSALVEAFYLRVDWPSVATQVALNLSLDVSSQVLRIRCPTAVIIGLADQLIPAHVSVSLYERLAEGYLFTMPCGHLIPAEDPWGLAQIVRLFLAQHAVTSTLPGCS